MGSPRLTVRPPGRWERAGQLPSPHSRPDSSRSISGSRCQFRPLRGCRQSRPGPSPDLLRGMWPLGSSCLPVETFCPCNSLCAHLQWLSPPPGYAAALWPARVCIDGLQGGVLNTRWHCSWLEFLPQAKPPTPLGPRRYSLKK